MQNKSYCYHFSAEGYSASGELLQKYDNLVTADRPISTAADYEDMRGKIARYYGIRPACLHIVGLALLNPSIARTSRKAIVAALPPRKGS